MVFNYKKNKIQRSITFFKGPKQTSEILFFSKSIWNTSELSEMLFVTSLIKLAHASSSKSKKSKRKENNYKLIK